jgi:hypothetical protein
VLVFAGSWGHRRLPLDRKEAVSQAGTLFPSAGGLAAAGECSSSRSRARPRRPMRFSNKGYPRPHASN